MSDVAIAVEDSSTKKLVKSFLSGGFGGMCLVAVGQPFDIVKVTMQTSSTPVSASSVVKNILSKSGPTGFFRGMAAPLAGVTPVFAVCFAGFEAGKQFMYYVRGQDTSTNLSLFDIAIAGGISAIPTTLFMTPGELIKIKMQLNSSFKGPMDVVKAVGAKSLMRGGWATFARDGSGSLAYFSVYEAFKRASTHTGTGPDPFVALVGGGTAGLCNWLVALPFDAIKSRYQLSTDTSVTYRSIAQQLIKESGFKGFYRGAAPALIRAIPANAACFYGMELSKRGLDKIW